MSPNVLERMRAVDAALKAKDAEPSPRAVTLAAERARLGVYSDEVQCRILVGLVAP